MFEMDPILELSLPFDLAVVKKPEKSFRSGSLSFLYFDFNFLIKLSFGKQCFQIESHNM